MRYLDRQPSGRWIQNLDRRTRGDLLPESVLRFKYNAIKPNRQLRCCLRFAFCVRGNAPLENNLTQFPIIWIGKITLTVVLLGCAVIIAPHDWSALDTSGLFQSVNFQ